MYHPVRGKRTRLWWAEWLCRHSILEEVLSEPLYREVLELKFIKHISNLPQSEKDRIFSKNFFVFVQTSDYWSETSLLLNLQCIYEHQRLYYIPSLSENKSPWLNISLCTEVSYSWKLNGFALFPPPFLLCPFPSVNDCCFLQIKWFAQLWALFCI